MTDFKISCSCGEAGVVVTAAPRERFRCHCTKCQSVYRAPYADALLFRRGQVKPVDPRKIEWIRTKSPSPLSRGLCRACGEPVLAQLYGVLSILPAKIASEMALPAVGCDIYYGTRVADVAEDTPKYEGAVATYLGLTLPITRVLALPGQAISAG